MPIIKHFREKRIPLKTGTKKGIRNSDTAEIIYLSPLHDGPPHGGVKVIYNHSEIINSLKIKNIRSSVFHPVRKRFSQKTEADPDVKATIKRDPIIDQKNDLVIIPEFWAEEYSRQCLGKGIRYALFIQNGYINSYKSQEAMNNAYDNAELILTISAETTECTTLAFPRCKDKILQLSCMINADRFSYNGQEKQNIITYMPRKLGNHARLVRFFLEQQLPSHWKIFPIENRTEAEVAEIMKRSKIFLSFSELEGLGLPPIEAALSGNKIIGYHGEGGKEYWKEPIFTAIESGNIRSFVEQILIEIKKYDDSVGYQPNRQYIDSLADHYSTERAVNTIITMLERTSNSGTTPSKPTPQ